MSNYILRAEVIRSSKKGTWTSKLKWDLEQSSIIDLDNQFESQQNLVNELLNTIYKSVIYDLKLKANNSVDGYMLSIMTVSVKMFINGLKCFDSDNYTRYSGLMKYKITDQSLDKIKNLLIYMLSVNSMRDFYKGEELLSNSEKAKILEGMFSSKARELAKVYFTNKSWTTKELESVNQIVEKLRLKYGMDFLRAILTIEKGEKGTFFAPNKLVLLRPDSTTQANFLIIHEGVEYSFMERNKSFRLTKKKSEFKRRNSNSNNEERDWMDLSLVLYAKVSQDPLDYIIQYGIETGKCSFCGLPLEDPTSSLVGYGKICAEKNNLLWGQ